jgi:hypothetical protein
MRVIEIRLLGAVEARGTTTRWRCAGRGSAACSRI